MLIGSAECRGNNLKSAHITDFEIRQSRAEAGYTATGSLAFMPLSGDSFAGAKVKLKIRQRYGATETYDCASFVYNMKSQSLLCDNSDQKGTSLIIDADFKVKKFAEASIK